VSRCAILNAALASSLSMLSMLSMLAAGCSSEICAVDSTINPGAGVDLQGRMVCLGHSAAQVQRALGPGETRQDLGQAGVRVDYPQRAVTLLFAGPADVDPLRAVTLHAGSGVRTAGGLTHGSSQTSARAELGQPTVEPMLGAWIYDELGLTLLWRDGELDRIQIAVTTGEP